MLAMSRAWCLRWIEGFLVFLKLEHCRLLHLCEYGSKKYHHLMRKNRLVVESLLVPESVVGM